MIESSSLAHAHRRGPLWKRIGAAAFVVASGSLGIASCLAPDESTLFIRQCQVQALDTCLASPDPAASFRSEGAIDVLEAAEYSCPLLVGNQMIPLGDVNKPTTETSRVELYQADVRILDEGLNSITLANGSAAGFSMPTTGFVDPGAQGIAYGLALVTLVDATTAKQLGQAAVNTGLQQNIVASVRIHGRTLGGQELLTAPFNFPITVCDGCLCQDPGGVVCTDKTTTPDPNCRAGLDGPYDCRFLGRNCP